MANDYRGLFEAAIARLQPGNAMEKAAFETIESGKRTAIGASMQGLVSGGMAGSSLAGSVPLIAEKGAAASRLGVTAARETNLSNVQMALGNLLFQGTEREKTQAFTASQNQLNQQFTASETEKSRAFTAAQNQLNEQFQVKQNALNREYNTWELKQTQEYQTAQAKLTRDFTANQATLDRQYGISTAARAAANSAALQSSAQKFTAEQNVLGRTATAEQNALQLSAQYPSLTGGSSIFGETAPSLFGGGTTGGGTTTGGWSSYPASKTSTAPTTGQSWVNGQYIPTTAEEKTYYGTPTTAGPTSIQTAMKKLTETVSNAPGGTNYYSPMQAFSGGGW